VGAPIEAPDISTYHFVYVFSFFLNVSHRMIEPRRIAAREKSIMGILMVPGACRFSSPIPPPITSNKAPRNNPIPFFIIAKK